jgi:hypothetical protein
VRKVIYTVQGTRGAATVDDDELQLAVMRAADGPDVGKGAVAWDVERRTIASDWMDASHRTWFRHIRGFLPPSSRTSRERGAGRLSLHRDHLHRLSLGG